MATVLPLAVSGGLEKTDFRLTTKFNKMQETNNLPQNSPLQQTAVMGSFYRKKLISLCGVIWLKEKGLYDLKDKIIRSVSCIPNIEGYEFFSLHNDGSFNRSVVKKNEKGVHYIDDFKKVIGWVPLNCP